MKTEQIIEEREDSVKMKMRFKRFLSGFMAVATLASVIIQPVAVSASELEPEEIPFEQQYEEMYAEIEYAEEERLEKIQFERNCPKAFFDGYDREAALKNYEGKPYNLKCLVCI